MPAAAGSSSTAAEALEEVSLTEPPCARTVEKKEEEGLRNRAPSMIERAGTQLQRASSNLQMMRASTLPTEDKALRHAATMPMLHDMEADRPWC
eukprot:CAMPEP_0195144896 /NCGR_PEP_ID=MMETSP0448-20130528/168889_1 /TAXON_ID=66468 /ORGANISM="Heterocapsa triquestra, Strain CCMP 448" /LENGTH=93 /DNA_ID=CAMNT_0040183383 /DNA_START=12 /DNA_END=290 /DNA_ORIENTATION=-